MHELDAVAVTVTTDATGDGDDVLVDVGAVEPAAVGVTLAADVLVGVGTGEPVAVPVTLTVGVLVDVGAGEPVAVRDQLPVDVLEDVGTVEPRAVVVHWPLTWAWVSASACSCRRCTGCGCFPACEGAHQREDGAELVGVRAHAVA